MNFDCGGKDLPAQRRRAFFSGQGFQEEINGLADIGEGLLDCLAFRLAAFQFRAPSVAAVLVLFDYDADLACHHLILPPACEERCLDKKIEATAPSDDDHYNEQAWRRRLGINLNIAALPLLIAETATRMSTRHPWMRTPQGRRESERSI